MLTLNNLRHQVTLRTDGGIKLEEMWLSQMMGAEEFGVATTALVAMGCIMVRQCHSNTCPVGVCTQDEKLEKNLQALQTKSLIFFFYCSEVREILVSIGYKS